MRHGVVLLVVAAFTPTKNGLFGFAFTLLSQNDRRIRQYMEILESTTQAYGLAADITPAMSSSLVNACLDVCCTLPSSGIGSPLLESIVIKELANVRSQQPHQEKQCEQYKRHFFDMQLLDVVVQALASTIHQLSGSDDPGRYKMELMEVAQAIAASSRFLLLEDEAAIKVLDDLDAVVAHQDFLAVRKEALQLQYSDTNSKSTKLKVLDSITDAVAASNDEEIIEALYDCVIQALSQTLLVPNKFPCTKLGVHCFCAATKVATNTQRAAAALGRVWHAADEAGPLIFAIPDQQQKVTTAEELKKCTLVVAFSSLGWNGVVRTEWGATIRGGNRPDVVIVHALDSSRTWYTSNPMTGACDDGAWWDKTLADLTKPYGRVCLLGDSMGGTAALRYARHSKDGTIVTFVPQINLEDFSFDTRHDFGAERKGRLRSDIQQAVSATTSSRIVIHVGRDMDDLQQLTYLEEAVAEHVRLGLQVDDPLPRDGIQISQAVGSHHLRIVKHDVEGHAIGVGLKEQGILREVVLADLFGSSTCTWADSMYR